MAGMRRNGNQVGQWEMAGFGVSCSQGGSALFQGTPEEHFTELLVGVDVVRCARFVLFYAAHSWLWRGVPC